LQSHEVLRQMILDVVAQRIASDLKVSSGLVHKWCSEPGGGREHDRSRDRHPLDLVVDLCECTGDRRPIEMPCQAVGGYFVEEPNDDLEKVSGSQSCPGRR
jgi:hypothetical protein